MYFDNHLNGAMLILIVSLFLKQFLWSAFIPLWQFPDEQAHFAQVQNYAEGKGLGFFKGYDTSEEIYHSEVLLGTDRDWAGNNKFTYHPEYNIEYSRTTTGLYESEIENLSQKTRTNLVIKEATGYPPLYYLGSAAIYKLFYPFNLFTRVFAVRIGNLLPFILLLVLTYGIAKLIFPRKKLLQITLLLFVGFHPMLSFLFGGINSYNYFIPLFTASIYISLLVINKGLKPVYAGWMIVILLLSLYTKHQSRVIPFLYMFPLIVAFVRIRNRKRKAFIASVVNIVLILGFGVVLRNYFIGRQFIPEIAARGNFRLSDLSFFQHVKDTMRLTIYQTIPWYWGVYRWLSLTYPRIVHRIINRIMIASVVGLFIYILNIVRKKRIFSKESLLVWFLIYASSLYYFSLLFFDFLFKKTQGFSFGIQGRYFFPTIIPHMTLLLIGIVSLVPWKRVQEIIIKFVGLSMIALHTFAFILVLFSYYAPSSMSTFFLQASQYKPFIFKSPFLEMYTVFGIASLLFVLWYYLRINVNNNEKKN